MNNFINISYIPVINTIHEADFSKPEKHIKLNINNIESVTMPIPLNLNNKFSFSVVRMVSGVEYCITEQTYELYFKTIR